MLCHLAHQEIQTTPLTAMQLQTEESPQELWKYSNGYLPKVIVKVVAFGSETKVGQFLNI